MTNLIQIDVADKIASTSFREVITENTDYRLKFTFDEEWEGYQTRVAIAIGQKGCSEILFTGDECALPPLGDWECEAVLVGVYAMNGEDKIASTFVRLSCRAGAGFPSYNREKGIHDQILSFINEKDWTIFENQTAEGVYSQVTVNAHGMITAGEAVLEVGEAGQSAPLKPLAEGGLFVKREEGGVILYYRTKTGLEPLVVTGIKLPAALTVAGKVFDGSAPVTLSREDFGISSAYVPCGSYTFESLPAPSAQTVGSVYNVTEAFVTDARFLEGEGKEYPAGTNVAAVQNGERYCFDALGGFVDLSPYALKSGLSKVATSGNYRDLLNKPIIPVTSVNGMDGDVVLDNASVGLNKVKNQRQMPLNEAIMYGADFNMLTRDSGFYLFGGEGEFPLTNAPVSPDNPNGGNCRWFLMFVKYATNYAVQYAFSARADCSVRIRTYVNGSWTAWKNVYN